MTDRLHGSARRTLGIYAPLLLFVTFALFPIYHMFLTSIKTDRALYNLSRNPLLVSLGALTAEQVAVSACRLTTSRAKS